MRSLLLRILLASLATILVSLVVFVAALVTLVGPVNERLIHHFQAQQIAEVRDALARGGQASAAAYLDRANRSLGATQYLTDSRGIDLVTGEDRSALLHAPRPWFGPPRLGDKIIVVEPSADGRDRLVIVAKPPLEAWSFAPYFAVILAAVGLLGWLLTMDIVTPLRAISAAVDRFGRGELGTRVVTRRRDEIGHLGDAFNQMAGRIETLLTAERRLLQDISHELRSPLARLNIAIELGRTAADRDAAAERLQKEVNRLTELVGSLLEVTRVEGDPSRRRSEPVRVGEVLHDVAQACQLEAEARGCRLVVDDSAERTLSGDPELLRRAVENIVRNAIRYAPSHTDVELRAEDGPAGLTISVRDAGTGVPDELLSQLAQPFFRVEDARDYSPDGGVGLGLSIAQRAVQLHHGRLVAENAHPGLRVTLTFPAASAA
ncbi:MAG TPA: ATP-binding protein [Vicinamibacterales bacterium]|jgi:two-component system sensor histidine kinase CpxA|nr:ATP-binding protein [Vicinamibacterales bacterium]